jgi:hypothetical protein
MTAELDHLALVASARADTASKPARPCILQRLRILFRRV